MTVWLGNRHINVVLKPGHIKIKINKHINEAEDAKRSEQLVSFPVSMDVRATQTSDILVCLTLFVSYCFYLGIVRLLEYLFRITSVPYDRLINNKNKLFETFRNQMIYNMPISHNLVVNVVFSETRDKLFVTATPHVKTMTMNTRWDGVQTVWNGMERLTQ